MMIALMTGGLSRLKTASAVRRAAPISKILRKQSESANLRQSSLSNASMVIDLRSNDFDEIFNGVEERKVDRSFFGTVIELPAKAETGVIEFDNENGIGIELTAKNIMDKRAVADEFLRGVEINIERVAVENFVAIFVANAGAEFTIERNNCAAQIFNVVNHDEASFN